MFGGREGVCEITGSRANANPSEITEVIVIDLIIEVSEDYGNRRADGKKVKKNFEV